MNNYGKKINSLIVVDNVDGNCPQIDEEFKAAFAGCGVEETTGLQIFKNNNEFPTPTLPTNTKDDSREKKEKYESNATNKQKVKDSKVKTLLSDKQNTTKVNSSKKDLNESKNTFIGKKTKKPKTNSQKKGENNEDKNGKKTKKSETKIKFNKDNSIKESMRAFILIMKIFIEILGDIIFNNFNCNDILGGVKQNEIIRKAKLYQILGYNAEYRKILRNAKPKNEEKFNYFLSRNFGFLFEKYFLNDRKFNINGKEEPVEEFKTINYEIKRRREKVYIKDDEITRKEKINNFIYASFLFFNDLKGCEQRDVKADKGLIDYTENRIEKFFIYAKKKRKSEFNFVKEKEKFLNLISKTNKELNNDNTLKSEFAFLEEKEKGFEQFMSLKKNIEEKNTKGIKTVTEKKILERKDSIFNSLGNLCIKEQNTKINEIRLFDRLNCLSNFKINNVNLKEDSEEQENFSKQEILKLDQDSMDAMSCEIKLKPSDFNKSNFDNYFKSKLQENDMNFDFPNIENLSSNYACLKNDEFNEQKKIEEPFFDRNDSYSFLSNHIGLKYYDN